MKRILWLVAGWMALSLTSYAASFDCTKAATKVERIICDNPDISKLDDELSQSYKVALQDRPNTEQVKREQRRWLSERNACLDATCVRSAYVRRNEQLRTASDAFVQSTELASAEISGKPGYFRLDQSNNDNVCHALGRIINADIKEYGEIRFDTHGEFVKWSDVDEARIIRGEGVHRYSGTVEQADVDINNDGRIDQVVRSKWAMSRVELDALNVLPLNESKTIDINELLKADKRISFIEGNYWRNRYFKKYGDPTLRYQKGYSGPGWDWYFATGVSIELFRLHGETYIVSQEYAALPKAIAANITSQEYEAQPNASAKIYVFQIDKEYRKYAEKDVCMFVRTCPCGGCEDVRGTAEEARALPAKKWCNK